jgi:hypothetical protein
MPIYLALHLIPKDEMENYRRKKYFNLTFIEKKSKPPH